jgi:hypothetical protein
MYVLPAQKIVSPLSDFNMDSSNPNNEQWIMKKIKKNLLSSHL